MSEILCFIPARGGSKRFKRKNLAPLRNRPVISYAIDAARNSGIFHRIVVSSEDREIREVADRMGATVDERPESLADDGSTVDQTLHEFLLRDSGPEKVICCVYPTAVLLKPEDLVTAAAKFHASSANSMMAVARYNLHPWQAQFVKSDGTLGPYFPEVSDKKSQDFPELLASTGTFYFVRREVFVRHPDFYHPPLVPFRLKELSFVDINFPEDIETAELLLAVRELQQSRA